eukprot:CAMPEP_0202963774 /NCGR_PEP_ID=MMETSP1396-20130829/7784_1 /ASSEMBLY_ACC=CAM_ASM_000872 /TAXON_ID= /ORGANISM="Pseudokeronopsis sp., Strain Brazil" /LENGTH=430 /DNA_ID=CAMNT_0049685265 /DNA_START=242 /DNA_END=1534 /DNA_ORIENTATION=+
MVDVSESLMRKFFTGEDVVPEGSIACKLVCLERGQQYQHLFHPLPHHKVTLTLSENLATWVDRNCQAAELGFVSYLDFQADVYWISSEGEKVEVGKLKPGEQNTFWVESYLGHEFQIINPSNNAIVHTQIVEYNSIIPIGEYHSHTMERDVKSLVRATFDSEWERAHRVKRTFTEFGFNRGKLPLDLFASMSAFYYNNKNHATIEEWGNKGVFVNWWERDVYFVAMPFKLKKYWQSRLKPLVEAWVGVPLELTDIYGMRRYEDGARLLTHVDREATHACSLIVNVAQGSIRNPWTIEVYDHADRLHEVEMNEGDIVYYESARCLHGRMQPLEGAYYVNLFAHYRPVGDPSWFLKKNPEGSPEPALDIGKCHSNGTKATCDGEYKVPFLSPTLEQLHGPQDLYRFWETTGRPGYVARPAKVQGQTQQHEEL